ncbi:hypothetical protein Y032_0110g194 [Ancylostoma ceylanicum]|uniref:Uncharacterized protein n=1 Tax=Ancylostoma ceylanicum TaxID=53326 RepID=A0A016TES5_9BILA|nr:hypothetical protein Y032_0110g194 [Ancylostoma ceylanicum]
MYNGHKNLRAADTSPHTLGEGAPLSQQWIRPPPPLWTPSSLRTLLLLELYAYLSPSIPHRGQGCRVAFPGMRTSPRPRPQKAGQIAPTIEGC